ncbi:hypothetical protein RND81_03G170700 [Saponaria officinalis]|uniref:Uncharacterized protein n=1 Tax=Saponaria officinalis TaxID=3572 RepID=A0AAW1M4N2_SAPOF
MSPKHVSDESSASPRTLIIESRQNLRVQHGSTSPVELSPIYVMVVVISIEVVSVQLARINFFLCERLMVVVVLVKVQQKVEICSPLFSEKLVIFHLEEEDGRKKR